MIPMGRFSTRQPTGSFQKASANGESAKDNRFSWRLNMQRALEHVGEPLFWTRNSHLTDHLVEARPQDWGDVIIARKDMPTSYHLSVVIDDALQGITHVVRGKDLFTPPVSIVSCSGCSISSRLSIIIMRLSSITTARNFRKAARTRLCGTLRQEGVTCQEIRAHGWVVILSQHCRAWCAAWPSNDVWLL